MPSTVNRQQTFPAVPPSLSAGDHETRDYYTAQDASRPTLNQPPHPTPYLGLRARLSQIWINRWTVLLLLALIRTLLAIASINDGIGSARTKALSACSGVEAMGSAMASMPHYLSQGVNELAATGVEKAVNGLMSLLQLSLSAVEEIVIFVINLLTQTYVCLITLAVSGSLHVALDLVQKVGDFLKDNLGSIESGLENGINGFTNDLNKFVSTLNSIPFVNNKVPKLDVSSDLNKLKTLQIPSNFDDDIQKINASIPNFQDVNNLTTEAIRLPFEEVKNIVNKTLGPYHFNRSVFPVPQKEKLSFCSGDNGINAFFDELVNLAYLARKVFIAVLVILAILACIPMAFREIRRWRKMERRSQLINRESHDPLDVVYIASRPYSSSFGIKIANRFRSTRRKSLVRWAVAYATSTPALFVLSLGIAGLFACLCQYILLRAIEREVPQIENHVGAFADKVVSSINNASEKWALGVNGAINTTNTDINNDVFGWVNTSTSAVNNTLNTFVDKMSDGLNKTFGGTILYDPIKDVLDCLITLKIQGIQKGLTWVHDHAHVDFPQLPADTFSLGAVRSITDSDTVDSFLADPGSTSKDEISEIVRDLVDKFQRTIAQEAIISICVILVWVIIALIGIIRAVMLFSGRDRSTDVNQDPYMTDPHTRAKLGDPRPESVAPPYEYTASRPAATGNHTRSFSNYDPDMVAPVRSNDEKVGAPTSSHVRAGDDVSPLDEKTRDPYSNIVR